MKTTHLAALGAAAALTLLLAGCAGSGSGGSSSMPGSGGSSVSTSDSPSAAGASAGDTLATASGSLGDIVVDGAGMTVYFYDKDVAGETASACTGACATAWPAVLTSDTPTLQGVTGTVGTIAAADGQKQVTVDGLPIYYYSGDGAAGDVNGQGVGGVWWAVAPDGSKVTGTSPGAAGTGSTGSADSSGGDW